MAGKKYNMGYLFLIVTFILWGATYIASKYALEGMGPVTLVCLRYLTGIICLTVLLKAKKTRKPVRREDWIHANNSKCVHTNVLSTL